LKIASVPIKSLQEINTLAKDNNLQMDFTRKTLENSSLLLEMLFVNIYLMIIP
jgi:hypothetical protein